MVRLWPARSWRPDSLRTKPSSAIASSTRWRVASATTSGRFRTFDTVPTDTPARVATSLTPVERRFLVPPPLLLVPLPRTS